ncbi:tyrosine-type recombinase/integrase [Sphingomonas baiyangensis]|uniref:Phage integrase family protein n=1 Tax=Sphingomonas baiyangensis TaxID=2572576 RepID=A0A4U1L2U1_9SPHN|nr:tyrosine-type recombinase/integrase [Sphingomonas baiyangensis]TKD50540.1 phage integrase family protein [Sphingomonas baiyangensis]
MTDLSLLTVTDLSPLTFAGTVDQWLAYRARLTALGSIARSTYANQAKIGRALCVQLGDIPLAGLRKSHIDVYAAARLQTCAAITVHEEVALLAQILTWAIDERLLADRPRMPIVSVPNIERPLPGDEDFAWYLRTLPARHADALEFMLLTGLAPHELERLQVRDATTDAIAIGGRPDFQVKRESRRREVPLNRTARAIWIRATLGRALDAHPFPTVAAMQKAMRRHFLDRDDAPPAADGLTPKMMRKWFASRIAHGHSEALLQTLLGHAPGSPVTRRHYVRTSQAERRAAVEEVWIP